MSEIEDLLKMFEIRNRAVIAFYMLAKKWVDACIIRYSESDFSLHYD